MTPFARLLGSILPACGADGAAGLPSPPPLDTARLRRPSSRNTALAAPAGFTPAPDIITGSYPVPPDRLMQAVRAAAARQSRTFPAAEHPGRGQSHWVARSALLNFPDLVTAAVAPNGPDASTLLLYSRAVYGYADFGANRRRITRWLAAIDESLRSHSERPPPE